MASIKYHTGGASFGRFSHGFSLCVLKHFIEQYLASQVGHLYLDLASLHTTQFVGKGAGEGSFVCHSPCEKNARAPHVLASFIAAT